MVCPKYRKTSPVIGGSRVLVLFISGVLSRRNTGIQRKELPSPVSQEILAATRVVKRSDRIQPRLLKVCVGRTSHRRELVRASATTRHGKKAKSTKNAKRPVASSRMVRDRCGSNSGRNCVKVELSFCRCVWPRQVQAFHEIQECSNERVVKRSDRIQPRLLKVCVGRTSHRREFVKATRHCNKKQSLPKTPSA